MHARPLRPALLGLAALLVLPACSADDPQPAAATPDPSPTASPTPSPTPGVVAPLTGVEVHDDPELLERPVLAVKIENTPAASPQAGLDAADVVFEENVEGGVTRFLALFHSHIPERAGPVRSARFVDTGVVRGFDAALVYSGARDEVDRALAAAGIELLTEGDPGFARDPGRSAPHNLFADLRQLVDLAAAAGVPPAEPTGWEWAGDAPSGGDGDEVEVAMSGAVRTQWRYDPAAGVYRRSQNGTATTVTGSGEIGAANVVVLASDVHTGGCCDSAGGAYVETDPVGEGRAVLLRDGRWYEGRWRKDAADAQYELTDPDGDPLVLAPGPTWIHLAPAAGLPDPPA